MAELYGRGKIVRFVADALDRRRNRDTPPVMLLAGPRGSGKTLLLEHLSARHQYGAPTCAIDLSLRPDATPTAVMWRIAHALSRHVANVGKPKFPLLGVGLVAVNLDPQSPTLPEDQLKTKLDRGPLSGQTLTGLVNQAGVLLPPDQQAMSREAAAVLGWIVDGYTRRRRNEYLRWYATLDPLAGGSGGEWGPLLVLYHKWLTAVGSPDPGACRQAELDVWRVLTEALLQDMRNAFDQVTLTHGRRTTNCLLLLDNADTDAGRNFLGTLAECRDAPRRPDPLLVVAAQGTRQPLHPSSPEPVPANDDRLSYASWLAAARGDPDGPPSPFYPVLLTDLSRGDVRSWVKTHVLGRTWFDADYVHGLTGGHPASAEYLADCLARMTAGSDPRDVLVEEAEDELLAMLRPASLNKPQLHEMAVFAATYRPKLSAAASVYRSLELTDSNEMDVRDRFTSLMWAARPDARAHGGDGLELRPLPRLLLQRWLARDRAKWEATHEAYLAYYRSQDPAEQTAEQYHLLALTTSITPGATGSGNLPAVAAWLDKQLGLRSAAEWSGALAAIATAPNRLRRADQDRAAVAVDPQFAGNPEDAVKQLAGVSVPGNRQRTVTRVIAARWLYNDRSFDPRCHLARLLAEEYRDLGRLTDGDSSALYQEASRFRAIAEEWKESM